MARYVHSWLIAATLLAGALRLFRGLKSPAQLNRSHIYRRVDQHQILRYDEILGPIQPGVFLEPPYPERYVQVLETATVGGFGD